MTINKDELIDVIENAQATYSNELTRKMAKYAADAVIKYIEQRSEPVSLKRFVIGDTQPKPRGTGKEIGKLVLHDIQKRIDKGVDTYGEPLKAHNGRNALLDAYEEALDLAIYLRQVIEESQ